MNIRPFRQIERRKSRKIKVGNVFVGGDSPITVQTMTNTKTTDIDATVEQINSTVEAGVDIVRVSCPDKASTLALKEIIKLSPVPIVADIHFHYQRAIEAGATCDGAPEQKVETFYGGYVRDPDGNKLVFCKMG